ncbi:MarR family transcriptional regulator [Bacillus sp. BRMEA1]|uniref:MarR family winged helix-turn-helix transcriptional regulator n=1 Tax=Neobacillus endophyticus TaxID=2738405 RepID=UPI0015631ECC|nr:MarR family transcriptional regulator [Neobacillus endophyticus]NRD79562.1 MarR family transcriptional regulator [Neobacillus endophyticus]
MSKKISNEANSYQQLPKLGIAPYLELMDKTAAKEVDRKAAYMGLLMLWLSDNVLDVVDMNLSEFNITESKLDLLLLLLLHTERKQITPSAIADRLGIRRASATAMLDWLEKRKWIVRQKNSKDGRMIHVSLSHEGEALVDNLLPTFWGTCASLLNDLDMEEQKVFEKILIKLNESIENRLGVGR